MDPSLSESRKLISGHEWRLVWVIIVGVMVLTSLPYLLGYLSSPPDRQFMGVVSGVHDWAQYTAWMKAHIRRVVIENTLTPEPQDPAFFNLQWFVLGRLASWFHLPSVVVVQVFRISASVFFLLLTYKLCRSYFKNELWAAWGAWLLINFSAGLGWILVLEKQFSGTLKNPLDVYVVEPVTFQCIIGFIHFLVAATLLLLIFGMVVTAIEQRRLIYGLLSGLLGLILGLTHAYDLIIVYGVLSLFALLLILRNGFSWFPILVVGEVVAISFPPPAYFLYLTTTNPIWREVLAQFKNALVFTPDPLHLVILLGIPLILTVLTFDGLFPLSGKTTWGLLIRVWCVVNFFLLYIPTDFQIHMLSGWQIPLGILASEGVFHYLLPGLKKQQGLKSLVRKVFPKLQLSNVRWILVLFLLFSVLPTNAYLLIWRMREVLRLEHSHYLYRDELEALKWLEENAHPSDIVFADLSVGMHIPGVAGNKVYLGHWAQTVDFYTKQSNVRTFFQKETPEEKRWSILNEFGVDYVFYGREESALGDFDLSQLPYLTLVFETTDTRIYRTSLASGP
jgi:hypothetical protein